jgi:hypothetical protein
MTDEQQSHKKDEGGRMKAEVNQSGGLVKFWNELKRRKVVRVGIVYAVVAWVLAQVAVTVFPHVGLPDWTPRFIIWILIIGFPITLIMAWAFEVTPEGIKAESEVKTGGGVADAKGNKLNYVTLGLVLLVLTFLVVDRYVFESRPAVEPLDSSASPASGETVRFTITLPDSLELPLGRGLAVSPDGQNIVFVARREVDGPHQLFRRPIDQLDIIELTEGTYPFFSPDGRSVGFMSSTAVDWLLQQMPLTGGPAKRLAILSRESSTVFLFRSLNASGYWD